MISLCVAVCRNTYPWFAAIAIIYVSTILVEAGELEFDLRMLKTRCCNLSNCFYQPLGELSCPDSSKPQSEVGWHCDPFCSQLLYVLNLMAQGNAAEEEVQVGLSVAVEGTRDCINRCATGMPERQKTASLARGNLAVTILLRNRGLKFQRMAHRLLSISVVLDPTNAAAVNNLKLLGGISACMDLAEHGDPDLDKPCEPIPGYHHMMLRDVERNSAYTRAIQWAIRNRPNSTVLDIGAGSGLMGIFAANAGAQEIHSFESVTSVAAVAAIHAQWNEEARGKVNVFPCNSNNVHKLEDILNINPGNVGIIVHEIFDAGMLGEGVLTSLSHAVATAAGPDTVIIPYRSVAFVQPMHSSSFSYHRWPPEGMNAEGVDYSVLQAFAAGMFSDDSHLVDVQNLADTYPVANRIAVLDVDFSRIQLGGGTSEFRVVATAAGEVHILVLSFDIFFPDGNILSTGPDFTLEAGVLKTHWGQQVFYPKDRTYVWPGDSILFSVAWRHDRISVSGVSVIRGPLGLSMVDATLWRKPLAPYVDLSTKCIDTVVRGMNSFQRYFQEASTIVGEVLESSRASEMWDGNQDVSAGPYMNSRAPAHALAAKLLQLSGRSAEAVSLAKLAVDLTVAAAAQGVSDDSNIVMELLLDAGSSLSSNSDLQYGSQILLLATALNSSSAPLQSCVRMTAAASILSKIDYARRGEPDVSSDVETASLLLREALDLLPYDDPSLSPALTNLAIINLFQGYDLHEILRILDMAMSVPGSGPSKKVTSQLLQHIVAGRQHADAEKLSNYIKTLHDPIWRSAFRKGIRFAVDRGIHDFADDLVVVEVGSGVGILSIMAAQAGAVKIIMCQSPDSSLLIARAVIGSNGYSGVVQVHKKSSCESYWDINLKRSPEDEKLFRQAGRINVLILDIAGISPVRLLKPWALNAIAQQVRQMTQMTEGQDRTVAQLVPEALILYVQLMHSSVAASYASAPDTVFGVNLSMWTAAISSEATHMEHTISQVPMIPVSRRTLAFSWDLAQPATYEETEHEIVADAAVEIVDSGEAHAVLLSHDLVLPGGGRLDCGIRPMAPEVGRPIVLLSSPRLFVRGEIVTVRVRRLPEGFDVTVI